MSAQDELLWREALEYWRSRQKDEVAFIRPLAAGVVLMSFAVAFALTLAFLTLAQLCGSTG